VCVYDLCFFIYFFISLSDSFFLPPSISHTHAHTKTTHTTTLRTLPHQTDAIIQSAVRTHFKDSTVIVVAHRLHTIIDCDQVLVIDEGRAVEQGSPAALLANKDGEFHRLVEATGPVTSKELHALALGKGKGGDEGGDCASAVPVI
jgi:hypothetical protein